MAASVRKQQPRRAICGQARFSFGMRAATAAVAAEVMPLGDSASDELLGAAEIRTPAFRRSDRARGRVRAVAAISVPAGWSPTHASTRGRRTNQRDARLLVRLLHRRESWVNRFGCGGPALAVCAAVTRPAKRAAV